MLVSSISTLWTVQVVSKHAFLHKYEFKFNFLGKLRHSHSGKIDKKSLKAGGLTTVAYGIQLLAGSRCIRRGE